MSRKTNKTTKTTATASTFEAMETRTMYSASPAVVGYLPDWEMHDQPAVVQNLVNNHFSGLTQLNYFSVTPNADGYLPTTGTNGDATSQNGPALSQLRTLVTAAHRDGVKVNIVVGGAGTDSNGIADILGAATMTADGAVAGSGVMNTSAAGHFAASVASFCSAYGLDGVDLDWEPAALQGGVDGNDDVGHYASLIHSVRQAIPTLQLSAAVLAEPTWVAPSYETTSYVLSGAAIADVNLINVMDYDLGKPGDGAPIEKAKANMTKWVTDAHAPAAKLVMGLPFYGRGTTLSAAQMPDNDPWGLVSDDNTGLPSYAKLVAASGGSVATTGSANLSVRAAISGSAGGHTATYNFDGPGTIAAKTNFALDNHFGGVMVWSLGQDTFNTDGSYTSMSLMPVIQRTVAARVTTPTPTPTPTPTALRLTGGTTSSYRFENNGYSANGHIADTADNNVNTYFASNVATGWYGLSLSAPAHVTQIKIAPRLGHGYNMVGGTFQASNDSSFGTGSVTLATITTAPADGVLTTLTVDAAAAAGTYSYVRYVSPAGSHGEAAEVQYFGTTAATSTAYASNHKVQSAPVFADNAAAVVDMVK